MDKQKVLLELLAEIVVYMNLEPMIEHWIEEDDKMTFLSDLTVDEFRQFIKNKGV
tara:strand:- start:350 stop:514 length:165 start_codon:yes stop_codon:yes gene_type:complete